MPRKHKPVIDRIMAKVSINDNGCWVFMGCKIATGYGKIASGIRNKPIFTHRASYAALVGEIPIGMRVLHRCDNPSCVNPEHLFLGTAKDNWLDAREKGRNYPNPQQTPNYRYVNHWLNQK